MSNEDLKALRRELGFRRFQISAISEFSAAVHATYETDNLMRIFFAQLMGSTGINRTFFCDYKRGLLRKRGFKLSGGETDLLLKEVRSCLQRNNPLAVADMPAKAAALQKMLQQKRIYYLLAVQGGRKSNAVVGLGHRFNRHEIGPAELEYAEILARFTLQALDNLFYWQQLVEKEKMQYEMRIARDIQRSLLPRTIPRPDRYDMAIRYVPTSAVGGDYYDILPPAGGKLPVAVADVEGKGLSAAMLAASSQAVFRSLSATLGAEPAAFVGRANDIVCELFGARKYVTLLWLLLHDRETALTYVNAGHSPAIFCRGDSISLLHKGGLPLGLFPGTSYEQQTLFLEKNDLLVALTDGVGEIEDCRGGEFGKILPELVRKNHGLDAADLVETIYQQAVKFGGSGSFRDDFTLLVVRVK